MTLHDLKHDLESAVPQGCVSDLVLDEWRAGELDAARQRDLQQHVAQCARCTRRVQAFEALAKGFLAQAPQRAGVASAPQRLPQRKPARWPPYAGGLLILSAAAALLLMLPVIDGDRSALTRRKGSDHIGFFVKRGERVYRGEPGERLHAGDQLRFVATTTRARYLAIFSVDAHGAVSVYHPSAGLRTPVGPGREVALDSSIELDQTQGPEHWWALFCDAPIDLPAARAMLERSQSLRALAHCDVDELDVIKEPAG